MARVSFIKHWLWLKASRPRCDFQVYWLWVLFSWCEYTLQRFLWILWPRDWSGFYFSRGFAARSPAFLRLRGSVVLPTKPPCYAGYHSGCLCKWCAPSDLLKISWFWLEMLFRLQTVNITNHTRGKITCMWMKGTSWLSFGHIKGDKRSLQS